MRSVCTPLMTAVLAVLIATPTTTVGAEDAPDLLPGVDLVTEEVEPGVFRVDSDGIRALTNREIEEYGWLHASLVAGLDGSVWLFLADSFYRIGDVETHPWRGSHIDWDHSGTGAKRRDDIEVGPDGTLWWAGARGERGLRSFDGDDWTVRMEAPFWGAVREVEIDSEGTVWVASEDYSTHEVFVGRLGDDGWEALPTMLRGWYSNERPSLSVGGAGDVWMSDIPDEDGLWRLADGESVQWEAVAGPGGYGPVQVSVDGTVWAWSEGLTTAGLSRFDGSDWTRFLPPNDRWQASDGWQDETRYNYYDGAPVMVQAAADGSVWLASWWGPCDGVTYFDGTNAPTFLPDICVSDMDVAPDGSLWVFATGNPMAGGDVFVITPEAVAATE